MCQEKTEYIFKHPTTLAHYKAAYSDLLVEGRRVMNIVVRALSVHANEIKAYAEEQEDKDNVNAGKYFIEYGEALDRYNEANIFYQNIKNRHNACYSRDNTKEQDNEEEAES